MIVSSLLSNRLLHLPNNFVTIRKKEQRLLRFIVGFEELCAIPCRGLPLYRNGLRSTSGRIRKAAPVTVAPDVVTSAERRDEARDSSVSLVRHVVLLLKVCRADGGYTRHTVPVYRYPFDPSDIPISRESEQHLASRGKKSVNFAEWKRLASDRFRSSMPILIIST